MIKILFVCLGNICRSPLAEAIFNDMLSKKQLSNVFTSHSAGTANYHVGNAPDKRSVKVAQKNNIPISHLGRQLQKNDFFDYHYILVMDENNFIDVNNLKPANSKSEILYLRSFDATAHDNHTVPDPYYGNYADFENLYMQLENSIKGFLNFLLEKQSIKK